MLGYVIAAGASAIALAVTLQTGDYLRQSATAGETNALAGNMLNYSKRVSDYAVTNPATNGIVPDASLALPAWFVKSPGIANYVDAGVPYVYYPQGRPGLAAAIVRVSKSTVHAGTKSGAAITVPQGSGPFTLAKPLPSAIPDGATVIVP